MLEEDRQWMREALEQARLAASLGEVPIGAVLVRGSERLGRGRNSPIDRVDPTAHAEILALREAAIRVGNYRLGGGTLYVTVEPCLMCLGAALHARLARIVFGAADPKVGAAGRLAEWRSEGARFNHRLEVEGGLEAEAAAQLLLDFFRDRRDSEPASEKAGHSLCPSNGEVPKWS